MLNKKISSKVLIVAPDYKKTLGGISQVVYVHSLMFEDFKNVSTTMDGSILKRMLTTAKGVIVFINYMLFDQIEIVHIHGATKGSFWRKTIFIYLSKLFRKKVIYHIHGANYKLFYPKYPRTITHVIKKCDLVIALSESWKDFFEKNIRPRKIEVLKNVVENPRKRSITKEPFCVLVFLGRLGVRKGIYDLLEVIHQNSDKYRGYLKLYCGGDGEVDKFLALLKEYQLEDMVQYVGWIKGEKKYELLSKADAYVLPSYNEGLPISILEAMSYKLPIISTNVGGIPEILENGKNGFLIEPGDKKALEKALDAIINSEEIRKNMGEASFRICEPYLPELVEEELKNIYMSLLEK